MYQWIDGAMRHVDSERRRGVIKKALSNGRFEEAIELCSQAIERYPEHAGFQGLLSEAILPVIERALSNGGFEEAIELCSQAIERHPEHPRFHCLLGEATLAGGSLNVAASHLERAIALDAKDARAYGPLAALYRRKSNWPALQRLVATAESAELRIAALTSAQCASLLASGRADEALSMLDSVIAHNEDVPAMAFRDVVTTASLFAGDAGRADTEGRLADFLERALYHKHALAMVEAFSGGVKFAISPGGDLAAILDLYNAFDLYRVGKFDRCGALLDGGALAQRDTALVLRCVLFYTQAQRSPKYAEKNRSDALEFYRTEKLPSRSPPSLMEDYLRFHIWIGSEQIGEVAQFASNCGLAPDSDALRHANQLYALETALTDRDARGVVTAFLEIEKIGGLPPHLCAEYLLAQVGRRKATTIDLGEALASCTPTSHTPVVLVLTVMELCSRECHAEAIQLLRSATEEFIADDEVDGPKIERLSFLAALMRYAAFDLRRRLLDPVCLDDLYTRFCAWAVDRLRSRLPRRDKLGLLAALTTLVTAFIDYSDKEVALGWVRSLLSIDDVRRDLDAFPSIVAIIHSSAQRPGGRHVPEMERLLLDALAESGQDVESILSALMEQGPNAPRFQSAIHVLDYSRRTEDIDRLCEGVIERSIGTEWEVARARFGLRNRRIMVSGATAIERLATELETDAHHFQLLVAAKLRLAKAAELSRFVRSERDLQRLDPSTAAQVGRIVFGYAKTAGALDELIERTAQSFAVGKQTKDFYVFLAAVEQASEHAFLAQTAEVLDQAPQPREPRGVLVTLTGGVSELNQLPLLAFAELKRRGFALFSAQAGFLNSQRTASEVLNEIDGAVGSGWNASKWDREPRDWLADWELDLPNKRAICRGINFYRGIEEALCCRYRRWSIDFTEPTVYGSALDYLCEMDLMISWVDRLKEIATNTKVPIVICVASHHSGNRFAARTYVNAVSENGDITVLASCDAYENYYSNFASDHSTALAVRNMTRHSYLSNAFLAPAELFDNWFRTEWKFDEAKTAWIDSIVKAPRIKGVAREETERCRARIEAARASGKKVICLLGKVLFDQSVPERGGPAHSGMKDWVKHTLETVAGCDDVLLLVKPHPHELRHEIAVYPSEIFQDWVTEGPNVMLLPHNMFNLYEAAQLSDLALVWNSSSSLELGIMEVPTVVCGSYGALDFPVRHHAPRDRRHYEEMLTSPLRLTPAPEVADRCRALLEFQASAHVAIPYRYTRRTSTNKKVMRFEWFAEDLEKYYAKGDPNIELIADRIEDEVFGSWR